MMTGGCLCGAVRYEAEDGPEWAAICYCRDCQRASGSGYVPVMGVKRSKMQITGSTSHFDVRADNGHVAVRHFCPTCGSLLFGAVEGPADETMSVYVGTLDDPHVYRPRIAIFTRSRLPWDCVVGAVDEYPEMPTR